MEFHNVLISAFLCRERCRPRGGHVQDDVAVRVVCLQQLSGLAKLFLIHGSVALVIAHVHVGDGGSCPPAGIDVFGNLLGSHGHIGVVLFFGPRPCGGYRDNPFVF